MVDTESVRLIHLLTCHTYDLNVEFIFKIIRAGNFHEIISKLIFSLDIRAVEV